MTSWTFSAHQITFTAEQYAAGKFGVQAWCEDEPYARLSVYMGNIPLAEGQFFLKDWSENERIADAMITEGLIERVQPPVIVTSGHVVAYAYEFTEHGKQYIRR